MNAIATLDAALEGHDEAQALELIAQGVPLTAQHLYNAMLHGAPEAVVQIAERLPAVSFSQMRRIHWLMRERQQCNVGTRPLTQMDLTKMRTAIEAMSGRALMAQRRETDAGWLLDAVYEQVGLLRSDVSARQIIDRFAELKSGLLLRAVQTEYPRIARLLLEAGAPADPTMGGRLPVSVPLGVRPAEALKRGFDPLPLHNVRTPGMYKLLVAHGANPCVERGGRTALHALLMAFSVGRYFGHYGKVRVANAKDIFSLMSEAGVDFTRGLGGFTIRRLSAGLPDELREHVLALSTGSISGRSVVALPAYVTERDVSVAV